MRAGRRKKSEREWISDLLKTRRESGEVTTIKLSKEEMDKYLKERGLTND